MEQQGPLLVHLLSHTTLSHHIACHLAVNEAALMDPQQRVLLEETAAAFRKVEKPFPEADRTCGSS